MFRSADGVTGSESNGAEQLTVPHEAASSQSALPTRNLRSETATIMVAMTTCNLWGMSRGALQNLASLTDDIEIVVYDDRSEDGTAERARQLGVTVVQVACIPQAA